MSHELGNFANVSNVNRLLRPQEVTLQKSSSQEQLGLTVSYIHCAPGTGTNSGNNSGGNNSVKSINEVDSEASTEVYISNILPDSIAARDGRLRQGDQILQVSQGRPSNCSPCW